MELLDSIGQGAGKNLDISAAVLDPYLNAIHVSLLREKSLHPDFNKTVAQLGEGKPGVRTLAEKWLSEGNEALKTDERLLVLSDPDTMSWLHRQSWLRPSDNLAPFWRAAISRMAQ
jgi:membrane glycosyltransferase